MKLMVGYARPTAVGAVSDLANAIIAVDLLTKVLGNVTIVTSGNISTALPLKYSVKPQ